MNKSILICFFGMDGSGKSTLSHYLYEKLKEEGINTSYTWWLEREDSFFRKLIRNIHKNNPINYKEFPTGELQGKKRDVRFKFFFRLIYPRLILTDYLFFGFFHSWVPMYFGSNKILIFDRYYPDTVSALSEEFGLSIRYSILTKLYMMIIPDPDLIFIIKVHPEISYNRKREEILSIENARHICERQERMYNEFVYEFDKSKILTVDNSGNISDTTKMIVAETMKFILS